ncbi:MAG TPA: 4Fe-4S binding protein [Clostridiales bacterium]|nr:4Fe-4S binding protein [Clostridiales bacterium]
MAYKVTDECISCGSCEAVCPNSAVSEGDGKFEIDASKCTSCGECTSNCPVDAIIAE